MYKSPRSLARNFCHGPSDYDPPIPVSGIDNSPTLSNYFRSLSTAPLRSFASDMNLAGSMAHRKGSGSSPRTPLFLRRSSSVKSTDSRTSTETEYTTSSASSDSPCRQKRNLGQRSVFDFAIPCDPFERPASSQSLSSLSTNSSPAIRPRQVEPILSSLGSASSFNRSPDEDVFFDDNRFVLRQLVPHHPFKTEQAPYMQSFSSAALDSDRHTHQLLCRINSNDSPSFIMDIDHPPMDVLDLGCGEGSWVIHAAKTWKLAGTRVTGFDLIDVYKCDYGRRMYRKEDLTSVSWIRGNFVRCALPFPDDSFDLVRMANLTLCIPEDRWHFVLDQVRRVLRPQGRLELIDDELMLPNHKSHYPLAKLGLLVDGHESTCPVVARRSCPTALDLKKELPNVSVRPSDSHNDSSMKNIRQCSCSYPVKEARVDAEIANHLQTLYKDMLVNRYRLNLRPHEHLMVWLASIFGKGNATKVHEYRLAVPSRGLFGDGGKHKEKELSREERRGSEPGKQSESDISTHKRVTTSISKLARVLLDDEELKAVSKPYQPPGLVLLPSHVVLPLSPLELEMHACKNMHVLLGCKDALSKYVMGKAADISAEEFDECICDYDRLKRKRFNWPMYYPGTRLFDSSPSPSLSRLATGSTTATIPQVSTKQSRNLTASIPTHSLSWPRINRSELTEVRVIRVYSAIKSAEGDILF